MILISHRGNIDGIIREKENFPPYIDRALNFGYDVEIDVWMLENNIFLGHDKPEYKININWINDRNNFLWVHCKNVNILEFLNEFGHGINYFWHENDVLTFTSKKYIWAFPGKQPIKNSIAVMPELYNDKLTHCIGICSNYIKNYK